MSFDAKKAIQIGRRQKPYDQLVQGEGMRPDMALQKLNITTSEPDLPRQRIGGHRVASLEQLQEQEERKQRRTR